MSWTLCSVKIRKRWILWSAAVFLLALLSYLYLDRPIFELLSPYRGDPLLEPAEILTTLGKSTWYILLSLPLFVYWIDKKPARSDAALLILTTTLLSGILVNLLKVVFGRARPQLYADDHLYGFFWGKLEVLYRSFPSGHATTAIAVWLAFALLFPRYRLWLIAVGVLVALSRVAVAQHYLSDVLVGGWLGAMTTLLLYQMIGLEETKRER